MCISVELTVIIVKNSMYDSANEIPDKKQLRVMKICIY